MAVSKQTRILGKRIDGGYIHRPHPMRRWRRVLTWGAGVVAAGWFIFAGVRFDQDRPRLEGKLYNPGPVTASHAYFENDCMQCHTGDGEGRFFKGVTDAACLKCHDGAIHHANQKIASDPSDVSEGALTLAVLDSAHPHGMVSASCVTCHVEHRGNAALAATSDAHCVVCHSNLEDATGTAKPQAAVRIGEFTPNDHPPFGRVLRKDEKWFDPTVLKFNHLSHQRHVKTPTGMQHNCTLCHQSQEPPARAPGVSATTPPYATVRDRALSAANSSDRRYSQPANYARHCAACHPLNISDATFAHDDLSLVRAQIADLREMYRTMLASMSGEDRDKALTKQPAGRTRRRTAAAEKMTEDEWVTLQTAKLRREVTAWFEAEPERDLPDYGALRSTATQPASDSIDPNLVEYYLVYGATNRCVRCHETNGGRVPSMISSEEAKLLATLPSGIPTAPRRWFAASQFNHDAHRMMSCVDCHTAALTSEPTSDLLLPDMTSSVGGLSCAVCHNPHADRGNAAAAGCVTCHLYHDRTMERAPDGARIQGAPQ